MVIQISIAPILQQKKTFIKWKTKNVLAFLSFMLLIHLGTNKKKMKKKYHTVGTVPQSNRKIVEIEVKYIPLTHKFMNAHIFGLIQTVQ